jgi:hypothetical protein
MNRFASSLFPFALTMSAQNQLTAGQGLPPLIDRELLFGNPEIAGAQISPDGAYIAFLKPWKDTRNIWVKKTTEPFSSARLLTAETKRPIPASSGLATARPCCPSRTTTATKTTTSMPSIPSQPPQSAPTHPPSRDLTGLNTMVATTGTKRDSL